MTTQAKAGKVNGQVYVIKPSDHWKTGLYHGSADFCAVDHEYDLNCLDLAISCNTLLYPISVSNFLRNEHDIFGITIVDLISGSALVGLKFTMCNLFLYLGWHRGVVVQLTAWAGGKWLLAQILVVVANIQMRTLKTEVDKGSTWTSIGRGE